MGPHIPIKIYYLSRPLPIRPNELWSHPGDGATRAKASACQRSGISTASDVVNLMGEDLDNPSYSRRNRARRHVSDYQSWERAPRLAVVESPAPALGYCAGVSTTASQGALNSILRWAFHDSEPRGTWLAISSINIINTHVRARCSTL